MTSDVRQLSFVEAVCKRPKMYTLTGTIEEVITFLHGFYSGLCTHSVDQRTTQKADKEWFLFLEWHDGQKNKNTESSILHLYNETVKISVENKEPPTEYMAKIYGFYLMGQHIQEPE